MVNAKLVSISFNLLDYFQLTGNDIPALRKKAVKLLRNDLLIQKTDKGQLEIIVWTKQKELSAKLANRLVAIIQQKETDIWEGNSNKALAALQLNLQKMETSYQQMADSLSTVVANKQAFLLLKMQSLQEQIKQYQKTADAFSLVIQSKPPALYVMESAIPAAYAERPDKPVILLATLLLSFIFSCLLVLLFNQQRD